MSSYLDRVLATSDDRVAWLRARSRGITATDAAKLASEASIKNAVWDKLHGGQFGGSAFTEHGKTREPVIAEWANREHGILASRSLFHAESERRHLATPDGLRVTASGHLELCEIKTTSKPWRSIPRNYLRQVWWQQYVLGAERTLVVWEEHRDFVPVHDEPHCQWVDRDDSQIELLVTFANRMLMELAHRSETPR
ncbi:MAG TPA: YqaJ viral recombinase family protein [Microbacteriaceae bacterium]|nr:YqaJ viral recombinase family protein [Microbacteriaceae bacterium]